MSYIASISHGKDSIAMLHVIKDILHQPLDRIITVDVWFDDDTRAELPPMVEWKDKADKIIYDRWGIPVEHLCAMRGGQRDNYRRYFYGKREKGNYQRSTIGFPMQRNPWCNKLKTEETNLRKHLLQEIQDERKYIRIPNDERKLVYGRTQEDKFLRKSESEVVQYLGIAYDELKRVERHKDKKGIRMPLVEAEWTEAMCYEWCKENDLLAPTYTTSMRDGCWFCHNQGIGQLRNLYHNYPDLWQKLLALDNDSPVTFHADGHTVHDFDRRFKWEDEGYKPNGTTFRWSDLDESQMNIFQFLEGGTNDKS